MNPFVIENLCTHSALLYYFKNDPHYIIHLFVDNCSPFMDFDKVRFFKSIFPLTTTCWIQIFLVIYYSKTTPSF